VSLSLISALSMFSALLSFPKSPLKSCMHPNVGDHFLAWVKTNDPCSVLYHNKSSAHRQLPRIRPTCLTPLSPTIACSPHLNLCLSRGCTLTLQIIILTKDGTFKSSNLAYFLESQNPWIHWVSPWIRILKNSSHLHSQQMKIFTFVSFQLYHHHYMPNWKHW
jgi:hypothetical protein